MFYRRYLANWRYDLIKKSRGMIDKKLLEQLSTED